MTPHAVQHLKNLQSRAAVAAYTISRDNDGFLARTTSVDTAFYRSFGPWAELCYQQTKRPRPRLVPSHHHMARNSALACAEVD